MGKNEGLLFPIRHAFLAEEGPLGFAWVGGALLFVAASGLAIWLLPFSVSAEFAVLMHTVLGLALLVPMLIWQISHWLGARRAHQSIRKFCGYAGVWTIALTLFSGLVVSAQAAFSLYVSRFWDQVHLWSGVAAVPFVVYHVWPHAWKLSEEQIAAHFVPPDFSPGRRLLWKRAIAIALALTGVLVLLSIVYARSTTHLEQAAFPASYSLPYGSNPFSPSLAMTATGKPVLPALLANSRSCGSSGCHTSIYGEWQASAHRWSSEDIFFQKVQASLIKSEGVPAARYCAGCHDPVSLLSGYKDASTGIEAPGFKEGASCTACHAMREVDVEGNGNYLLAPATPYLFEYQENSRYASAFTHFLIRAYPKQHDRDYDLSLVKRPESCASCHKQFIDKNINHVGWVQLQNQYDDWRAGKWNTAPVAAKRLRCQQCHMYYESVPNSGQADPYDLKAGLGLEHRNHWFAAGNQVMPELLHSPDWRGQIERVNQWLEGEKVVPEISSVWPGGPVMPVRVVTRQADAIPGKPFAFQVVLTNSKAGHSVPTGPLDLIRAWVEVKVSDESGRVIFHSGELTPEDHVEPGTFVLKAVGVSSSGQEIVRHDLWHYIGARWKRAVFPGYSDMYAYTFVVPRTTQGPLVITARLRYRKANEYFMNWAFPGQGLQTPITDLSFDRVQIQLAEAGGHERSGGGKVGGTGFSAAAGPRK